MADMTDNPTLSFPFGSDVSVLILCRDDDHRRRAIKALGIKAQYETISTALMGYRFEKIIWIGAESPKSAVEAEMFERMRIEYLPTKLTLEGELIVL